jgi:hypothetical protein
VRQNGPLLQGFRVNGIRLNGPILQGAKLNGVRQNGPVIQGVKQNGARAGQAISPKITVRSVTLPSGERVRVR